MSKTTVNIHLDDGDTFAAVPFLSEGGNGFVSVQTAESLPAASVFLTTPEQARSLALAAAQAADMLEGREPVTCAACGRTAPRAEFTFVDSHDLGSRTRNPRQWLCADVPACHERAVPGLAAHLKAQAEEDVPDGPLPPLARLLEDQPAGRL